MKFSNYHRLLSAYAGIFFAVCMLVLTVSCEEEPEPVEPDPVGDFFKDVQDGFDLGNAESVVVIAVDDNINAGQDLQRQVFQEIQTQLRKLNSVAIIEHPTSALESRFVQMGITPADGIAPDSVIELAESLGAGALLYASLESDAPDVYVKVYAGDTGAVVFSQTLQQWSLPVTRSSDDTLDLLGEPGMGADLDDAESHGTAIEIESSGTGSETNDSGTI